MAAAKWYYQVGNQKFGPLTSQELQARAAAGLFSSTDLVWKEGLAKWMPASRVDSLVFKTPTPAAERSEGRVEPPPNPGFARISRGGSAPVTDDRGSAPSPATPARPVKIPPAPAFIAPRVEKSPEPLKVVEQKKRAAPLPVPTQQKKTAPPVESGLVDDIDGEIAWDFRDDTAGADDDFDDAAEVRPTGPAARPLHEKKRKPRKVAYAGRSGQPASFFRRFVAAFIDGIIVWLLMLPVGCFIALGLAAYQNAMKGEPTQIRVSAVASVLGQILGFLIEGLYHALMTSSPSQATFGKSMLSIRVTDTEGYGIDFLRAAMREFARTLPMAAPAFIFYGWLWIDRDNAFLYRDLFLQITIFCLIVVFVGHLIQPFTSKRQALHDMLAGTLVVND